MNSQDFVKFALQITVMVGFAVVFGQLMRRVKQPAVLGEMIGGIGLGPTIFGLLAPSLYAWLFQSSANVGYVNFALGRITAKPNSYRVVFDLFSLICKKSRLILCRKINLVRHG
jgi:hypothetical protein